MAHSTHMLNSRTRTCRHTTRQHRRASVAVHARTSSTTKAVPLPKSYNQLIQQAQESVKAAIADGVQVMEVEFPPSGLASVPGDGEGKAEMDESMKYLRQFLNAFRNQAANTRVFFPELAEMRVAKYGKGMDPNAGSPELLPQFGTRTGFQLDYLTKPNMWWEMGLDVGKLDLAARVKETDQLLIAAYPYFNIQEMISVTEMWEGLKKRGDPKQIMIFNGELDRIRSGYYSSFIVPRLNKVKSSFMPQVEGVYYLRNIKRPTGSLFRAYPGPWQVIRRNPAKDTYRVIYTSDQRPDLRKVALEILPDPTL